MEKTGNVPPCLSASLAFYLAFYHGKCMTEKGFTGFRSNEEAYTISDDRAVLTFFDQHKEDDAKAYVHAALSNAAFWGKDLTELSHLEETVLNDYLFILEHGCYELMKELTKNSK